MPERIVDKPLRRMAVRYRGRGSQVWIYLGKLLRMFVYQNDWKVLPMAAVIAGLVGIVVRSMIFIHMEGTLMGAFAIVMVCVWNGCFNSIQVICRERDVIKREHRSGMHISSYITAHMIYQALLCLAQTVITIYVTMFVGVKYPVVGLVTRLFILDFGISLFLITFASDMMALWVSSLSRSTTTAMTIMPFVLIFQLVFSGGMLTLPEWAEPMTNFTISSPGLKAVAAQADINHRPYATISGMVSKMRDSEISGDITLGQVLDILSDETNPTVAQIRALVVDGSMTFGEWKNRLYDRSELTKHRDDQLSPDLTLGELMDLLEAEGVWEELEDVSLGSSVSVGEIIDRISSSPDVQTHRSENLHFSTTVGALLDLAGENRVRTFLEENAAQANYVADYDYAWENVAGYWTNLVMFIVVFAVLAVITLEFIDKDKR